MKTDDRFLDADVMKSPILEQIADGLNKLGRRGSTLLKDFIEVEYMDLSDDEVPVGLEEPGLHEVAGFGSLVLELPTPPREEPRPEVINWISAVYQLFKDTLRCCDFFKTKKKFL